MTKPTDLMQGTLHLLILKTINLAPAHGWAIAQSIRKGSTNVLQATQGVLYPALHRLGQQGWIKGEWGESDNNRRAKDYSLTRRGKTILKNADENWCRLSHAIGLALKMA
jgi:PadR family transcriptional regulator PadR